MVQFIWGKALGWGGVSETQPTVRRLLVHGGKRGGEVTVGEGLAGCQGEAVGKVRGKASLAGLG